jgi:hypothetical protein
MEKIFYPCNYDYQDLEDEIIGKEEVEQEKIVYYPVYYPEPIWAPYLNPQYKEDVFIPYFWLDDNTVSDEHTIETNISDDRVKITS